MSAQPQPSWDSAAAAAYYAYATQAASAPAPTLPAPVPAGFGVSGAAGPNVVNPATAQIAGKISQLWDSLQESQRSYYLAAVQSCQPPPSSEAERLGYAKLMAHQHFEQYQAQQQLQHHQQFAYQAQAQPWTNPTPSPHLAATHQQLHHQPSQHVASSKRSKLPAPATKGHSGPSAAAPWRSSSTSNSPNLNHGTRRSGPTAPHAAFSETKADRKRQMGDFVREMLTLLKASPPACADYVKEKLKPLGQTFLHDPSSDPLPSVRTFVTGAIAEYKRQHLITNPSTSPQARHPHPARSESPAASAAVYGPSRPSLDKSSAKGSAAAGGVAGAQYSAAPASYAAAASLSSMLASPLVTSNSKKRRNAATANADTVSSFSNTHASSSSTYSFASSDSLDPEEIKKREREQRFRSAEQRLAAERAAAQAMARANLAHYQEVHRAARTAASAGDDDTAFDDPENEHGDLDDVVVGTSQALEKPFLRLTSAPDPTEVRPLPVLEKAIVHLMNKWKEARDYRFMCDQLKSVRQDLLVQRIQNELTVKVYELHARIALEVGDFSEFNQCQTQLKILYERGVAGCHAEFLAYRILYFLYTKSRRDMKLLLSSLSPSDRANHYVSQALAVRAAVQRGDYLSFYYLYRTADLLMGSYLLDPMMDRERVKGLWAMTKSHMTVRMDRIVAQLAWNDAHQARVFINRVVDQVCDARCVQPVPTDRSEYKVQEGAEVLEGKKVRVMMEAWLVAFTKVDIKGQLD